MSFYPIISNLDVRTNLLSFSDKKTFMIKHKDDNGMDCRYLLHNINYIYDRIGNDKLCVTTPFIKITKFLSKVKDNGRGKLHFFVAVEENSRFSLMLIGILEYIKTEILKKYPEISPDEVVFPMTENGESYLIELSQFDKKNTTPIHYHRSKKQGGQVVTISGKLLLDTRNEIYSEMSLFKKSSYGKPYIKPQKEHEEIKDQEPQKVLNIYYEGKFTLTIGIEYAQFDFLHDGVIFEHKRRCKILLYAKECETKFNVSKVKSVLDVDITHLNKENTKVPAVISI